MCGAPPKFGSRDLRGCRCEPGAHLTIFTDGRRSAHSPHVHFQQRPQRVYGGGRTSLHLSRRTLGMLFRQMGGEVPVLFQCGCRRQVNTQWQGKNGKKKEECSTKERKREATEGKRKEKGRKNESRPRLLYILLFVPWPAFTLRLLAVPPCAGPPWCAGSAISVAGATLPRTGPCS